MINIRRIIYILKQKWGTEVDLYKEGKQSLEIETGKITYNRKKYTIKKAIVLPSNSQFNNPLIASIAKMSGTMITASRYIILDAKDLNIKGVQVEPEEDDYIDYRDERYQIVKVEQFDRGIKVHGYYITVKEAKKELPFFITDFVMMDRVHIAQSFKPNIPINRSFGDSLVLAEQWVT
jgi:hypothetical protein